MVAERVDRRGTAGFLWTIWIATAAVVTVVVLAVAQHLGSSSAGPSSGDDMSGMQMAGHTGDSSAAVSLTRLRSNTPLGPLLGSRLITVWQLDAVAVLAIVLVAAWYLTALVLASRRNPDVAWPVGRTFSFLAGLAVCGWATNGSVAVYDMGLFSAHMIGHLAFVMVAPALLMAGRPIELALVASRPPGYRRLRSILDSRVFTLLTAPPVALACYATVIVGSHLTGLMDTIMKSEWAGQAEHLIYLVIGCQFFLLVLGDAPVRWQLSSPARWVLLALSMAVDTFTGIVIMQSTQPIAMTPLPGLNVNTLTDTHTGGAIMWFAGDGIMAAVMIALVLGWLRDPDRRRRDNAGWMEQARRVTFAERTGAAGVEGNRAVDDLDFDEEDVRLADYNAWLASLNRTTR
jgi:cytochrome c oxidase assembly factor CtaG